LQDIVVSEGRGGGLKEPWLIRKPVNPPPDNRELPNKETKILQHILHGKHTRNTYKHTTNVCTAQFTVCHAQVVSTLPLYGKCGKMEQDKA
jgi:hypothetical protein